MPQDIAQTISGNGNEIALDQINALTANNYADNNDVYQSANSSFNDNHVTRARSMRAMRFKERSRAAQ